MYFIREIKTQTTNYIINTHSRRLWRPQRYSPPSFQFGWAASLTQPEPPSLAPPLAHSVIHALYANRRRLRLFPQRHVRLRGELYSNRCPELQRHSHRSPGDCNPPTITTTTSSSPLHPYQHLPTILILILTLVQVNISILTARLEKCSRVTAAWCLCLMIRVKCTDVVSREGLIGVELLLLSFSFCFYWCGASRCFSSRSLLFVKPEEQTTSVAVWMVFTNKYDDNDTSLWELNAENAVLLKRSIISSRSRCC